MRTVFVFCILVLGGAAGAAEPQRPNILWISCEDTSPWLGFCGEKYATTPNLDRMAQRGLYLTNAFVTAPVCSPSRFAIITGCYATSHGTQRLRSHFPVPDAVQGFPTYLRQAGYYCTNNVKTDYNTSAERRIIADSWDESSGKAHWRGRRAGQPFFAVFNLMETHQSKIFESTPPPDLEPAQRHDPGQAPIPPYYPDTPAAHRTMARVHDCITAMDQRVGQILAELEQDGLADDTIVVFWPDHGQGIPRGKRTLWDTGLKIPVLVDFPPQWRHLSPAPPGGTCDRLISLMDLGPTMLSIVGLPIPDSMQGRAFFGPVAAEPREYIFGARDRVDEALDVVRSVRDKRYLYLRNFMPDLSWNQPETYSNQLELRREITQLAASGQLDANRLTYAADRKPYEALYDTQQDPWQLRNLAADPQYQPVLERLRRALRDWQAETRDVGMLDEWQADQLCKATGRSLFELAREPNHIPLERVLDTAWRVGVPGQDAELVRRLEDPDPTIRYWAAVGLRAAGPESDATRSALAKALSDESLSVRIEAAGVLAARYGDRGALDRLVEILGGADEDAALHAARTLQLLGEKARPVLPALEKTLPHVKEMYARWALQGAIATLNGTENPVFKARAKPAPQGKARKSQPPAAR